MALQQAMPTNPPICQEHRFKTMLRADVDTERESLRVCRQELFPDQGSSHGDTGGSYVSESIYGQIGSSGPIDLGGYPTTCVAEVHR